MDRSNNTSQSDGGVQILTHDLRKPFETGLSVGFLVITMVVAILGNTAVIAVVMKQRVMKREVSNLLIINLSITDLSNTLLVMMSALVALVQDDWPFGKFWCDCTCAINYCLIIVSMLTLCSISIDRYQAVMHPLSYTMRITRTRIMLVIGFTWVQGMIFGMVPSFLNWVDFDYWEAICAIQWHLYRPSSVIYVISAFLLCFLGPGIILIYCYSVIISEVKKQKIHLVVQKSNEKMYEKNKWRVSDKAKITWSLLTVVLAYFICTTPFSVTKLIKVSASESNFVPGPVNLVASLLGYVASAINPLIYGIFRRDYRTAYIQLIKSVFGCKRMTQITTSSEISHSNAITTANQVTVSKDSIGPLKNTLKKLSEDKEPHNTPVTNGINGNAKQTRVATIADQYNSKDLLIDEIDHNSYQLTQFTSTSPVSSKEIKVCDVL